MSLYAKPVTAADLAAAQAAMTGTGTLNAREADALATLINSDAPTVAAWLQALVQNATILNAEGALSAGTTEATPTPTPTPPQGE